jgi:hypothetical protein
MADSAKVILKKKEVRSNSVLADRPLGLASLSVASPPPLLPASKDRDSCQAIRQEILSSRAQIETSTISYMRLSLLNPQASDNDGKVYTRLAINMDVSLNNESKFKKFKWRLTNKRSEFYANIPDNWQNDLAYGSAWEFFNELTMTRWIGKATYRLNRRDNAQKMKLADFTAMVVWTDGETMHYRLWIENAEVTGAFDIESTSRYFTASSEPIKNFTTSRRGIIEL